VPRLDSPDEAFAAVAQAALPVGVTGIVLAAALAAIMSTASATLLAASTITASDLLQQGKDTLTATRIATLVLGVAVVGVSLVIDDVVAALTVAYDLLTGALFVPIVLGLLWPRGTSRAAVASMSVSAVIVVVLLFTRGLYSNAPIIWGLVSSLVVFVGVSMLPERGEARGRAPRLTT
jgi:solute:Na+ symporter, SSS family